MSVSCLHFIYDSASLTRLFLPPPISTHNRLSQTKHQNRSIEALYAEQQRRSDTAETNIIRLTKRLQDLTQSNEVEKNQIRYQAEERLQTESSTLLAEANKARAAKEEEIKALNDRNEKNRLILENKIEVLSTTNAKLNSDKMASENESERLATKLSYTETTNSTLTNEVTTLQSQLKQVSDEKKTIEKSLHQLQLELTSLAQSNNNQERTISQAEAQRVSAEQVSSNAKQTLSRQQSQLEELKRRLEEAELETSKYKDLTSRYQTNRLEMKKRVKEKVEMIREQEDVLIVKEKETTDLKCRVKRLEEELHKSQTEKSTMSRDLSTAKKQAEDDKKKLENNQQVSIFSCVCIVCLISVLILNLSSSSFTYQVIAWLNKQVNKSSSSGGATTWQRGLEAAANDNSTSTTRALPTPAFPTPLTTNSQASGAALSRLLPNNAVATPYQRLHVTPDLKPSISDGVGGSGGMPQLHPGPTPYSMRPHCPT